MFIRNKTTALTALVLVSLLYAVPSHGFSLTLLDAEHHGDEFRISAAAELELPTEVIEALDAHIDIVITVQTKIYRIRDYLIDDLVADSKTIYVISTENSYSGYSVRSSDGSPEVEYDSLSKALDAIGRAKRYKITLIGDGSDRTGAEYRGKIRIFLDRTRLPSLLQTTVYFKKAWRQDSGWVELELQ